MAGKDSELTYVLKQFKMQNLKKHHVVRVTGDKAQCLLSKMRSVIGDSTRINLGRLTVKVNKK